MQYALLMLLAANDVHLGLVLVAMGVIGVGAFVILTPARYLLQSDRRTARLIYESEMKRHGDKEMAIAAAAFWYRLFGSVIVAFGLVLLVLACIPSQSN
jgi:hypothetical protein